MKSSFKLFVLFMILSIGVLISAATVYAECGDGICMNVMCLSLDCGGAESHENCPEDCGTRENCYNGMLDVEERAIDCGDICWTLAEEVCDNKDNDGDCSVDEGPYNVGSICDPATWRPFCSNGVYDRRFEVNVDCGYICKIDAAEICDGKDNDKDCEIDENCGVPPGGSSGVVSPSPPITSVPVEPQPRQDPDSGNDCVADGSCSPASQPEQDEEVAPASVTQASQAAVPVPVSAPVEESVSTSVPASAAVAVPATPAKEVPAVSDINIASLTDEELGAFIEQNAGADFIRQMRKLADDKGVYIPMVESDAQFGRKYVRYFFKHQSELAAKFEGKEPTEEDFVDLLRQFSEEAYPKPVQQQSFFSKLAGFFKGLFGG